jgi:hypothetical protein
MLDWIPGGNTNFKHEFNAGEGKKNFDSIKILFQ